MPNGFDGALAGGENASRLERVDRASLAESALQFDDAERSAQAADGGSAASDRALQRFEAKVDDRLEAVESGLNASLVRTEMLQADLTSRLAAIASTLMRLDAAVAAQGRALDLFASFEGLGAPDDEADFDFPPSIRPLKS